MIPSTEGILTINTPWDSTNSGIGMQCVRCLFTAVTWLPTTSNIRPIVVITGGVNRDPLGIDLTIDAEETSRKNQQ